MIETSVAPAGTALGPGDPGDAVPRRPWARGRLPELGTLAAAAVLSLLAAAYVLQLQTASLSRAWFYKGDALFYEGVVKGILDHGYYLSNPDLGAPLGLHSQEFPLVNADLTQVFLVRLLGVFLHGPFAVSNAFFLLTFPLVAVSACWGMRHLGVSRVPAVVVAVLFAVLPYHFVRNVNHLFYSSYYTVPLICVLVLDVLAGRPVLTARAGAGRVLRWLSPVSVRTVAFVLLIAVTSAYYAVFAVLLLGAATLLRVLATRDWRALVAGGLLTAGVLGGLAVAQLPTLAYQHQHGKDALVAQRQAAESETFALKLDQLVLPVRDHRVPALARFANHFEDTTPLLSEPTGNLGLVGSLGLAWLGLVALAAAVRPRAAAPRAGLGTDEERHAGLVVLVAFVISTVGGLSAVIAYVVTPQIRSWSRMSVVIGFLALLGVGYLLDRLWRRARQWPARALLAAGLAVLLGLGLLDQTAPRYTPDYAGTSAEQAVVEGFVAQAQAALPAGTAVLQLPYLPYPENGPVNGLGDYENIRPYLSSTSLRWTYGAVKGSPDDWNGAFSGGPLPLLLDAAALQGFGAVYVDRFGYKDAGAALEAELGAELGAPLVRSTDQRLGMWDLRGRVAALAAAHPADQLARARAAAQHPVRGFMAETFNADLAAMMTGRVVRDAQAQAHVTLVNDLDVPQQVVLDVGISRAGPKGTSSHLAFPDGSSLDVPLGELPVRYVHVFTAPAGSSRIELTSQGGSDAGDRAEPAVVLKLVDPLLVPLDACLGKPADVSTAGCTAGVRPQNPS